MAARIQRTIWVQESAHDLEAFNRDPMQVNANWKDWDKAKAPLGLVQGVRPGQDLSVKAGIQWLAFKAYQHGDTGAPDRFLGWHMAAAKYNGGGVPGYADSVFRHLSLLNQAQEDSAQ